MKLTQRYLTKLLQAPLPSKRRKRLYQKLRRLQETEVTPCR